MNLNQEITQLLESEGCKLFGFADLRILPPNTRQGFDVGIVMGMPFSTEGMKGNLEGKTEKIECDSGATFEPLNRFQKTVFKFLKEKKYKVSITYRSTWSSGGVTNKMIGTLAGIGWIGRCAILTTKKFGTALRLTAVLTNAPLKCGTPITESLCPKKCNSCADICPTNSIKDGLWKQGVHRDEFFDIKACRKGLKIQKGMHKSERMCGLCMSACPFAKKGLGYV